MKKAFWEEIKTGVAFVCRGMEVLGKSLIGGRANPGRSQNGHSHQGWGHWVGEEFVSPEVSEDYQDERSGWK